MYLYLYLYLYLYVIAPLFNRSVYVKIDIKCPPLDSVEWLHCILP